MMARYKVETRQSIYRTYHIDANSTDDAEKRAMSEGYKDAEWVGAEEIDYYDTEALEAEVGDSEVQMDDK